MYTKIKHSNLSSWKLKCLIDEWVYNTPARVCADKLHLNKNTVNLWYSRIRFGIAAVPDPLPFSGIVEVDETYLAYKRIQISKDRYTVDSVPIFGIRERSSGHVWAMVVPKTDHTVLVPLIKQRVVPHSTIYSDGFGAYYHLKSQGYTHHVVLHEYTFVNQGRVHTNGIESFWAYLKHFLATRKGLSAEHYQLHLKEAQKRFNTSEPKELRVLARQILRSYH